MSDQTITRPNILGKPYVDINSIYTLGEPVDRHPYYSRATSVAYNICTEKSTGQTLVCKSILKSPNETVKRAERIRLKVKIFERLGSKRHPNIFEFKGAYEDASKLYLVSELLEIEAYLSDWIEKSFGDHFVDDKGAVDEDKVAYLFWQILFVVQTCHAQGVIIRYLRPYNFVVLAREEEVVIKLTSKALSKAVLIQEGEILYQDLDSTYYLSQYEAPELKIGNKYGKEVDVWRAGAILFHLLIHEDNNQKYLESEIKPMPSTFFDTAQELTTKVLDVDPREWARSAGAIGIENLDSEIKGLSSALSDVAKDFSSKMKFDPRKQMTPTEFIENLNFGLQGLSSAIFGAVKDVSRKVEVDPMKQHTAIEALDNLDSGMKEITSNISGVAKEISRTIEVDPSKRITDVEAFENLDIKIREMSTISDVAKDLLTKMLEFDPGKRITAAQALEHPWLKYVGLKLPWTQAKKLRKFQSMVQVVSKTLPEEMNQQLKSLLNEMDTYASVMTLEELKVGLSNSLASELSESELMEIMIAVEEFYNTEFVTNIMSHHRIEKEKIYKAFQYFDKDCNGFITREDLREAMTPYRMGNEADVDDIIDNMDTDKDGKISYKEFENMIKREMQSYGEKRRKIFKF